MKKTFKCLIRVCDAFLEHSSTKQSKKGSQMLQQTLTYTWNRERDMESKEFYSEFSESSPFSLTAGPSELSTENFFLISDPGRRCNADVVFIGDGDALLTFFSGVGDVEAANESESPKVRSVNDHPLICSRQRHSIDRIHKINKLEFSHKSLYKVKFCETDRSSLNLCRNCHAVRKTQ